MAILKMHSLSQQFVALTTMPPVTCAAAHLTNKADAEPTAAVKLLQAQHWVQSVSCMANSVWKTVVHEGLLKQT